jgi:hypothetical protein
VVSLLVVSVAAEWVVSIELGFELPDTVVSAVPAGFSELHPDATALNKAAAASKLKICFFIGVRINLT